MSDAGSRLEVSKGDNQLVKSELTAILSDLEKGLPKEELATYRATYSSKVNYKGDLELPFQRWFNYKEGYSLELNDLLIDKFSLSREKDSLIVDPFSGSGTTLLAAKRKGISSIGIEVNPFSHFFATIKTKTYSKEVVVRLGEIKIAVANLKQDVGNSGSVTLPLLGMSDRVFSPEIYGQLTFIKRELIDTEQSQQVKDLLMFAWVSILEECSLYRKAGNGLKRRVYKKYRPPVNPFLLFEDKLSVMHKDLDSGLEGPDPVIHRGSALNYSRYVQSNSADLVVFSPPYANCFDYTEIYKVELWFGGFIKNSEELKKLRLQSMRSHLNHRFTEVECPDEARPTVALLESQPLWDKKIPKMIAAYFQEMETVLQQVEASLKQDGHCVVIVSNSAYSSVVVATDLIIAQIAKRLGFKVIEIEVVRQIITSSQQFHSTESHREFLRESMVVLQKVAND